MYNPDVVVRHTGSTRQQAFALDYSLKYMVGCDESLCSCYLQDGGIVLMVAALVLLGEGLQFSMLSFSDLYDIQHVDHSALLPFICVTVQKPSKSLPFNRR